MTIKLGATPPNSLKDQIKNLMPELIGKNKYFGKAIRIDLKEIATLLKERFQSIISIFNLDDLEEMTDAIQEFVDDSLIARNPDLHVVVSWFGWSGEAAYALEKICYVEIKYCISININATILAKQKNCTEGSNPKHAIPPNSFKS